MFKISEGRCKRVNGFYSINYIRHRWTAHCFACYSFQEGALRRLDLAGLKIVILVDPSSSSVVRPLLKDNVKLAHLISP